MNCPSYLWAAVCLGVLVAVSLITVTTIYIYCCGCRKEENMRVHNDIIKLHKNPMNFPFLIESESFLFNSFVVLSSKWGRKWISMKVQQHPTTNCNSTKFVISAISAQLFNLIKSSSEEEKEKEKKAHRLNFKGTTMETNKKAIIVTSIV